MSNKLLFEHYKGFLEITTSKTSHIINYTKEPLDDIFENDFTFVATISLSGQPSREGIIRIHGPVTGLYSNANYLGWETATVLSSKDFEIDSIGNLVESLDGVCCIVKRENNIQVTYNGKLIASTTLKNSIYPYSKDRFNNIVLGATSIHHDEWQEASNCSFFNFAGFKTALSNTVLKEITNGHNFEICKNGLNLNNVEPKVYYDFENAGAAAVFDASHNGNVGMMYYAKIEKQ